MIVLLLFSGLIPKVAGGVAKSVNWDSNPGVSCYIS